MMKKLLHRLRGQVRVRVTARFPERALNICSARGVAFWDLKWESGESFLCTLSRRDWPVFRAAAEEALCRVEAVYAEGAPYLLRRLRRRTALMVGFVLCGTALFLGSFFIWDFTVTGNQTVPTEKILRALEANGVRRGRFALSLDGEEIRNRVLLDLPELSFLTVNVSGCRAEVTVRERVPKPKITDGASACNVVSRRAGVVTRVRTLSGKAAVAAGSSVTRGQLLISGVRDTETFGSRLLRGCGSVEGRTWYRLTTNVPLRASALRETGRTFTGYSLVFGTHRIKFFSNSSIAGEKCDKITKRTPLTVFSVPLPLAVEKEQYRFFETETTEISEKEAQARAEDILSAILRDEVTPFGEIEKTETTARRRGDVLTVTLTAECREELGVSVPIYTEETDGASG
ncbi:MAG: sporulation protein YqfD [Oscillibacter sp.]|nr:sporulation protein YqfD [Oscillibacter sp.]